jgi:hypothetical protein
MNPSTKDSRANPRCLLVTLATVALLLSTNTWSASSPDGPTQKEVFELRSLCGALADRDEKAENAKSTGILYWYRGHYDPQTNRCVEKIHAVFPSTPGVQQDFLLDAQSHALLAKCMLYTDPPGWGCEIHHKEASHEQTEEFFDAMMGSDK